jgi:sulfur relay (sulfurtransferase) DsrC/TusE family protein
MYVTHIATYNRYISSQENVFRDILNLDFDELFSEENLQKLMPKMLEKIQDAPQDKDGYQAHQKQWEEELEQPLPVVRKIPVKNSKSGLVQLHLSLTFAQIFAKEYWEGNNSFNPLDLIKMLASKSQEERP